MTYFSGLNKKIENRDKKPKMAKPKLWAIVLTIVASVGYFSLFTNLLGFMKHFLLGTFGIFSYVMFAGMYFVSGMLLKRKRFNLEKKYVVILSLALFGILAIFHMAFSGGADFSNYGKYLSSIYEMQVSIGGLLLGLVVYPLQKYLSFGAYILFGILLVICVALVYNYLSDASTSAKAKSVFVEPKPIEKNDNVQLVQPANNLTIELNDAKKESTPIGLDGEIKKEETARERARRKLGLDRIDNGEFNGSYTGSNQLDVFTKNYVNKGGSTYSTKSYGGTNYAGTFGYNGIMQSGQRAKTKDYKYEEYLKFMGLSPDSVKPQQEEPVSSNVNSTVQPTQTYSGYSQPNSFAPETSKQNDDNSFGFSNNEPAFINSTESSDEKLFGAQTKKQEETEKSVSNVGFDYNSPAEKSDFLDKLSSSEPNEEQKPKGFGDIETEKAPENNLSEILDNNLQSKDEDTLFELPKSFQGGYTASARKFDTVQKNPIDDEISKKQAMEESPVIAETSDEPKQKIKQYRYTKPSLDLLTCVSTDPSQYGGNVEETGKKIEDVLEEFKIPAKIKGITRGPAVTRYELEMPVGISVNKIPALEPDIKMRIATTKNIMIQAPIPGMSAFGIEVPNDTVATVSLKEVLSSDKFKKHESPCAFALGKEIDGDIDVCAVNKMPHVLIAGSTGSGKSVCLNSLILSILFKSSPEDVKFILIDPKRVEFSIYQGLPHLVIPEIISEPRKADNALGWAVKEMERRYVLLEQHRVRDIKDYNNLQEVKDRYLPKMPYIIIIMDEFADMMQSDCKDIENKVSKLAAKARAAGIHLVLATQRPSVDVLSGTAKNNFPARIAFYLTSQTDSRTILGYSGAENLLGRGDMLYVAPGSSEGAKRLQGCYVSDDEVKRVVDFVIEHNQSDFDPSIEEEVNKKKDADSVNPDGTFASYNNDDDEEAEMEGYAKDLLKEFIRIGKASASYIQRVKRVGFNKAARILDYLAKKKYISMGDGSSKPRTVYITKQQYIELFGDTDFDDHD